MKSSELGWGRILAFASCLAFGGETSGQQQFGETVDVQLINVEVWVTDRQGLPITGLGIEDFEVLEDGRRVEISNFSEIRSSSPGDPFASPPLTAATVTGTAAEKPLELEDLLETPDVPDGMGFLVIYFDELFSKPAGRRQLLEDLRTFVELRRVPHERVLILRQDKGIRVEANLGSNRQDIEAALDRLEQPSALGAQTWAEERNALQSLLQLWESEVVQRSQQSVDPCGRFSNMAFNQIQVHINLSRARIADTLEQLSETAGFLAGLPGPKTLIYVSDGLSVTPGGDLLSFVRHLCPGRQEERRLDYLEGMSDEFRRLSRHANANRVTIYTLQSLGLRNQLSATSADQRAVPQTIQALSRFNSESRLQHRQGLGFLADETGGRAILNRGRFIEELEMIAEDMTGYYSLAYEPPHGGDGLEHEIEVKVRGEKLRVRHRPGYRDKSRDQQMLERLQSALYLNLMANPLAVKIGAGEISKTKGETFDLPLHVRVPVDKITFLPQAGGDFATLGVLVQTRDERLSTSAFKRETYRLEQPAGAEPGMSVSLVINLELKAGIHVIAFAVQDESTREASFVATAVDLRSSPEGPS